jgi:hypothetical protein
LYSHGLQRLHLPVNLLRHNFPFPFGDVGAGAGAGAGFDAVGRAGDGTAGVDFGTAFGTAREVVVLPVVELVGRLAGATPMVCGEAGILSKPAGLGALDGALSNPGKFQELLSGTAGLGLLVSAEDG